LYLLRNRDLILKDYYLYLVVLKAYTKNTTEIYFSTADGFIHFIFKSNVKHLNDLENYHYGQYILYVRKISTISFRTTNITISALNNFKNFLCKKHSICNTKKLKQLKFQSFLPNIMESDELLNLFKRKNPDKNSTSLDWLKYRNYALAIFLYSTGMRINEAMSFTLADIDGDWVRVENGKNKKTRVIPINTTMLVALNNYIEMCPFPICKIFWFARNGKKLSNSTANKAIVSMFSLNPHYFRHAFATHLIRNGCELMVVKDFLGHSSLHTTSIYTHIKPKHLKESILFHPICKSTF